MTPLLTVREAAALLHVSRAKVYELIGRGMLRSLRIDGARRIRVSDVEQLVADLARQTDAEESPGRSAPR